MTKEEMMKWIDKADYGQLLRRLRFAPSGDPFFIGDIGKYYQEKMKKKELEISSEERVRISKLVGWVDKWNM